MLRLIIQVENNSLSCQRLVPRVQIFHVCAHISAELILGETCAIMTETNYVLQWRPCVNDCSVDIILMPFSIYITCMLGKVFILLLRGSSTGKRGEDQNAQTDLAICAPR